MKKNTLLALSFSLLSLLLLSCTNSTSIQTGTLAGKINLEGQSDHSGIVIGIYELAELDTDIVEANQKWPHIGVKINQHTEFDHRFGTLVKTGETDASGYFEINDIPTGIYNVVAIKNGFGFRYIYEISISDGDNSLSTLMKQSPLNDNYKETDRNFEMNSEKCKISQLADKLNNESSSSPHYSLSIIHYSLDSKNKVAKADLILYPENIITSDINEATTFESYHHYIIEQDIVVDDELTIQTGVVIRVSQGKEITSYGSINAIGEHENFIWFTKNDAFSENLNTIEPDSNYIWDRVTLEPLSQAQIQWCKFDWVNIGLINHINGFEITDCIFRDSNCGFKAESVDSTLCNNLFCIDINSDSDASITFIGVANGFIKKNIIIRSKNGQIIKDNSNPQIINNYIKHCDVGLDISYGSTPIVRNNDISDCEINIYCQYNSSSEIKRNNCSGRNCIIGRGCSSSDLIVQWNNLNCNEYAIKSVPHGTTTPYPTDIDAINNFFFSVDQADIQEMIYDKNNVPEPDKPYTGIIYCIPYLTQEYNQAGIQ